MSLNLDYFDIESSFSLMPKVEIYNLEIVPVFLEKKETCDSFITIIFTD